MDFIRAHQLDIMLIMCGSVGILAIMTLMPKFVTRRKKVILMLMESASLLLLVFDRLSYVYRGDESRLGGIMVRVSNGMCYLLILFIPFLVTHFIRDMFQTEGNMEKLPKRLYVCDILFGIGAALVAVSQFTGLYYTFDEHNKYQRAPLNFVSYIVPLFLVIIQESVVLQYRKKVRRKLVLALAISIILPTVASVFQFIFYGISLITVTMAVVVAVFFIYVLCSLGEDMERARKHEIEFYKEAQERESTLFEETAEALTNAIDAKDKYTCGHSVRVASLSRLIAKEAGVCDDECEQIYFAALLHDVGKIGVPDEVINKQGKLTKEEYAMIMEHPVAGYQILSSIRQSPYLSIGAHYHHERYDGTGYPDGLKGEEIPVIARIIAVADAYDAMTSTRSYREALSKENVRSEIENGMGRQFDPKFAAVLLSLMDRDMVGR